MAYTDASNKAVQKYSEKVYDRCTLRFKKGDLEGIKAHAKSKNQSLNSYISNLIVQDMKKASKE